MARGRIAAERSEDCPKSGYLRGLSYGLMGTACGMWKKSEIGVRFRWFFTELLFRIRPSILVGQVVQYHGGFRPDGLTSSTAGVRLIGGLAEKR